MNRPVPGSARWWQDTVLITLAGVALAIWLWDGWPYVFFMWVPISDETPELDLGDYFDAGCVTSENLHALAEGRPTTVSCSGAVLRSLPVEQGLRP